VSVTASQLRELAALGLDSAALIRAVEIIEASALSADKSADVRRGPLESTASTERKERDKLRKRATRASEKAAKLSAKTSADKTALSADRSLSSYDVSSSLLTEEVSKESKKETSRVRARGTRMVPGTPLSDEHLALILAEGIHDPEKLWIEFVDYWSDIPGYRGVRVSWKGTLRNRCRDVIKRGFNVHPNSPNRTHQATGSAPTRDAAVIAAMGRTLERRRAARAADDPGRDDIREAGRSGPSSEPDAESGSAPDDDRPPGQFALVAAGYSRG
jgi:hypothetical protein